MSAKSTASIRPRKDTHEGSSSRGVPSDPYQAIANLATSGVVGRPFLQGALEQILRAVHGLSAAMEIRTGDGVVHEQHSRPGVDEGFWSPAVQEVLTRTLAAPEPSARLFSDRRKIKVALLGVPLRDPSGHLMGAVAVVAACDDRAKAGFLLQRLYQLSVLTVLGATRQIAQGGQGRETDQAAAGALRKAATYTTSMHLAMALVNSLKNKASCDVVALGRVHGHRVRVVAVSGHDRIVARHPGVGLIRGAMEECLDAGHPVISQDGSGGSGHRLHARWRKESGASATASVPLRDDGRIVAVLSMRKDHGEPFTSAQLEDCQGRIEPFMPALRLLDLAGRGVFAHVLCSTRGFLSWLMSPRGWGRKAALAVFLFATTWFFFGTVDYRLSVPGVLRPASMRHLAAPVAGRLVAVEAVAGDRVRAGGVLCVFDTSDLRLEASRLDAEIAVTRLEERQALAEGKPGEASLAAARLRELEAERAIVAASISDATVRSPVDGVVLSGDLRDRLGDAFQKGEPLFQISPTDTWRLELKVPETWVTEVREGMSGAFATHARPEVQSVFSVTRCAPAASAASSMITFPAEARIEMDAPWVRSGMEGLARIEIGPQRPWWAFLRGAVDTARLYFWF